ncbi:hypothetical protein M0638_07540 [Roseomonas sp. NAR14]|uniref:Uncharacterized protein n=1 Tax=Roseomonas acroporae TaxID=2937791 RepID=A0A9X2BT40_9PROT|nr:hypothetical protein [Roseomonas acroporae]MCK8784228.1 hypothetical protein [Roseomonas acroporae]
MRRRLLAFAAPLLALAVMGAPVAEAAQRRSATHVVTGRAAHSAPAPRLARQQPAAHRPAKPANSRVAAHAGTRPARYAAARPRPGRVAAAPARGVAAAPARGKAAAPARTGALAAGSWRGRAARTHVATAPRRIGAGQVAASGRTTGVRRGTAVARRAPTARPGTGDAYAALPGRWSGYDGFAVMGRAHAASYAMPRMVGWQSMPAGAGARQRACPAGTVPTLARGHADVVRCLPF